jgi:pyrroline-5-carboxylate reductase
MTRLAELTGAERLVRAMSSPAAGRNLAYSPWFSGPHVTDDDRALLTSLFSACGKTDEVFSEEQIDCFTALTGPVPGFVAFFAECMTTYATAHGIEPRTANRAIHQLFHASGVILAEGPATPADQVQAMIEYAGTTAAGLKAMRGSPLASLVHEGLDAARRKAREFGAKA